MVTPEAKRMAVKHLQERFGQSRRRICRLIGLSTSTWHYKTKPNENPHIRQRLRDIAGERRRWGYRQMHEILRREGIIINHKRTERLYREEGLQLQIRRRKKTAATLRVPLPYPEQVNQRWAMDFMSDNLADGRKIRLLNILEVFTKESLAMVVDTSINGTRISQVLDRLGWMKGLPEVITVDNGPEFTGKVMDSWAYRNGVKLEFSRPGKPVDNAFIESFNRTVRDECLNDNWFLSLEHARKLIEAWRVDYNTNRPHSALGGLTPAEFAAQFEEIFQEQVLQ